MAFKFPDLPTRLSFQNRLAGTTGKYPGSRYLSWAFLALLLGIFALFTRAALNRPDEVLTNDTALTAWNFTPDIIMATLIAGAIYISGMLRRRSVTVPVPWWRHALFFAGLGSVFLALQSPVDAIADRLFFVHQIQHILLRMFAPMLIALSWPEGILTAGLPAAMRQHALAPVISNGIVRRIFSFLSRPLIATFLFIAALYIWEIPRYHNYALDHEGVHYVMHITMLLAGLIFWWRIFDRRPPKTAADFDDEPKAWWRFFQYQPTERGLRYGGRLLILILIILSNIILGAYTTLKASVLYTAYDTPGRLFNYAPIADEQIGGIIIWVPSSMMCLIALLIILHWWGLHETRMDLKRIASAGSNSAAFLYPETGKALREQAQPRNRSMAIGFALFVAAMFATPLVIGVLSLRHSAEIAAAAKQENLIKYAAHSDGATAVQ